MKRWLVVCALTSWTLACGSSDDDAGLGSGGAGGNIGQQGCTTNPDCNACSNCYSLCVCTTGDAELCKPACGLPASGGSSGAGTGGVGGGTGGAGGGSGGAGGTPPTGALASSLAITEIAVYQAVKVPIMQNGAPVATTNAPVVAGRNAMFRVYATPDPGFQPREIVARLEITGQPPIDVKRMVSAAAVESDLNSTFNIEVPGAALAPNAQYTVTLLEANPGAPAGPTGGARFPASGAANTGAASTNGPLEIVIVPLISNGYTPDTAPNRLEQLRSRIMALYPVPDVQFTLRNAVTVGGVSGSGQGFGSALNTLENVREADNAAFNVYYYGLLAPAQSAQQFCGFGCVAGLSNQTQANDADRRASVGIAYFPDGSSLDAPDTMAHEVGHAHGLPHAPCQTQDAGQYPYPGGAIGVWGYDLTVKTLLNPNNYKDVMGYCDPDWISDFNFKRLFTRVQYVNSNADWIAPLAPASDPARAPGRFRTAVVDVDGSISWGATFDTEIPQTGELKQVSLLDESGQAVGSIVGFYYPFLHISGGTLYVREKSITKDPGISAMKPAGLATLPL